jgi:hypothetical protein
MSDDHTGVRWMTAFLDSPEETAGASERFWSAVTGSQVSPRRGRRDEFATLLPEHGDPFLRVQQVVQSAPGAMHLDVHSDDVEGLAARAERLGASASYHELGYVVCGSPGGLTFCVVPHPGSKRPPPQRWPGGRSLVDQVCLDIPPSRFDEECDFWAALTGWERRHGTEFDHLVRPQGQPLRLLLQRLDDEQPVATMHLDLACDDRDAEEVRHRDLGAARVRRTDGWTTLRDPAGRDYCLTRRSVDTGTVA